MTERRHDEARDLDEVEPAGKQEIMQGVHGRGQRTAGDREIMEGAHGRGQRAAGDREIMEGAGERTRSGQRTSSREKQE